MKKIICGLDEAGRGPLAGPVTAGCVVLPEQFPFEILNDSKKLSPKKREYAERVIKECACWGLGVVDEKTIDKINILQASLLAMKLAYEAMMKKLPAWCTEQGCASTFAAEEISAIADGTFCPDVGCECRCEIKADGTYHVTDDSATYRSKNTVSVKVVKKGCSHYRKHAVHCLE